MIILDTETTGLDDDAEICEIAMIDGNGKVLMNTLVKPTISIPGNATLIHGITNKMVADAPTWAELHQKFKRIVKHKDVYIYNAEYDLQLLEQTALAHGLTPIKFYYVCVMHKYAKYAGKWSDKFGDWIWHKLSFAACSCNLPIENAHRALGDCQMTLGVLNYMKENPRIGEGFQINPSHRSTKSSRDGGLNVKTVIKTSKFIGKAIRILMK